VAEGLNDGRMGCMGWGEGERELGRRFNLEGLEEVVGLDLEGDTISISPSVVAAVRRGRVGSSSEDEEAEELEEDEDDEELESESESSLSSFAFVALGNVDAFGLGSFCTSVSESEEDEDSEDETSFLRRRFRGRLRLAGIEGGGAIGSLSIPSELLLQAWNTRYGFTWSEKK
jgi:hypothetical protein